jgi:hypothetical protein
MSEDNCSTRTLWEASDHVYLEPFCYLVYKFMSPSERCLDAIREELHLRKHHNDVMEEKKNGNG